MKMIKIIDYGETSQERRIRDAEEGELFQEVTLLDLTQAIEDRLNDIPNIDTMFRDDAYARGKATCFLVKIAFNLHKLDQYLEVFGPSRNTKFILNFTQNNYLSKYSIAFQGDLNFTLLNFEHGNFSRSIKAPLISIKELREKHLPLCCLENGRDCLGNKVYSIDLDNQFCLPIRELVLEAEMEGLVNKYCRIIEAKYYDDIHKLKIKLVSWDCRYYEFIYEGYIDLKTFKIVIETTNRCRFD